MRRLTLVFAIMIIAVAPYAMAQRPSHSGGASGGSRGGSSAQSGDRGRSAPAPSARQAPAPSTRQVAPAPSRDSGGRQQSPAFQGNRDTGFGRRNGWQGSTNPGGEQRSPAPRNAQDRGSSRPDRQQNPPASRVEQGGQRERGSTRQPAAKPAPSGRPGTAPARTDEWRRFGSNRGGGNRGYDRGGHYNRGYGWGSHGWGHHGWGWTWYSLFGFGFGPPPWYWNPFYWGPTYYQSYWWPWFGGWTVAYVPYPYDPYYPAGVIGYCGQTGIKFDTAALTDSTDKKIVHESEVYADGTYAGTVKDFDGWSKDALQLNQGDHTIEVRLPNGESFTRTITVRPCEITAIHIPQLPHPAASTSTPPASKGGEQNVAAPGTTPGAPAAQDEDELLQRLIDKTKEQDRIIEELKQKLQQLEKH